MRPRRWKTSRILDIDPLNARVQINIDLAPDDIVFGFYAYEEKDVIFQAIDVNPFSNPDVKNRIVELYYADRAQDPFHKIFYRVLDESGAIAIDASGHPLTNDKGSGGEHVFATLSTGFSVGENQFTIEDVRERGGGLAQEYQAIEQAAHMWDLGHWDGKPYPLGGTMVVYLQKGVGFLCTIRSVSYNYC